MLLWIVCAASIVAVVAASLALLRARGGELEFREIVEYVPKSPSLRILSIAVREYLRTPALYIAIGAAIVSSIMAASVASSQLLVTHTSFSPLPGERGALVTTLSELSRVEALHPDALVAKPPTPIEIHVGEHRLEAMVVAIQCLTRAPPPWLCPRGRIVLDESLRELGEVVCVERGPCLEASFRSLEELSRIYLAPDTPLMPSFGRLGASTIVVKNVSRVAIAPLPLLEKALPPSSKLVALWFGREPPSTASSLGTLYVFNDSIAYVYRSLLTLSPASLLPLAIVIALTAITTVLVCGGVAERIRSFSIALLVQGVSLSMVSTSIVLGLAAVLAMFLPIDIAVLSQVAGGPRTVVGVVTYIASSALLTELSMRRALRGYTARSKPRLWSFVAETRRSIDEVATCLRSSIERDEFFTLTEIETLHSAPNRYVIRLELVYRRAMAVLVSVEAEVEHRGTQIELIYAEHDVWSFEELPKTLAESIGRMALSRVVGTLWICAES